MDTDTTHQHLQVLASPKADGTWRARIFEGGVKKWECMHPHPTIEVAWECGRRQEALLRELYRARALERALA